MTSRPYKSGSRWALWRVSETPSGYITRLHVIMTPWFAICVHFLNTPDPEPYLHDHPVTFLSLILRGDYLEHRKIGDGEPFFRRRTWWNYIRASADDRHTIMDVAPNTVTLCFMGPKRRDWGFHTDKGWEGWREYNRRVYGYKGEKAGDSATH